MHIPPSRPEGRALTVSPTVANATCCRLGKGSVLYVAVTPDSEGGDILSQSCQSTVVTQHLIHCTEALSTGLLRGWRRLVVFLFPTLKHAHSPAGRLLRKPDDKLRQRCCWGGIPLAYRSFCSADHAETLTKNGSYTKVYLTPGPLSLYPCRIQWCGGPTAQEKNVLASTHGRQRACACSVQATRQNKQPDRHPAVPARTRRSLQRRRKRYRPSPCFPCFRTGSCYPRGGSAWRVRAASGARQLGLLAGTVGYAARVCIQRGMLIALRTPRL